MKKISYSLVMVVLICIFAYAAESVYIDSFDVQTYNGKLGKWHLVPSYSNLKFLLNKYGTSGDVFFKLNKSKFISGKYYFIPFSEKYKKEIQDVIAQRTLVQSKSDSFIWPIMDINRITSSFGMRLGQLHAGIDLPANGGTPILAATEGRVVFSGYAGGHGNSIYIEHRNNYHTRYSHNSVLFVKKGDYVKKGQVIGLVGSTGNSTGNHLHFEIRYNSIPLNPIDFLPQKKGLCQSHYLRNWK